MQNICQSFFPFELLPTTICVAVISLSVSNSKRNRKSCHEQISNLCLSQNTEKHIVLICNSQFTDTNFDPGNCGGCNQSCATGGGSQIKKQCLQGKCVSSCGQNAEVCGSICCPTNNADVKCCKNVGVTQCINLKTDVKNCGTCGNACCSSVLLYGVGTSAPVTRSTGASR